MKYLLYTDVHWNTTSSIIRSRGEEYSIRLENLINSVNWAENRAKELNCDGIICLGDFFDKPDLTSEQLTALKDVIWTNDIPHYFIVGNHESPHKQLKYHSVNALKSLGFNIINEPSFKEVNKNVGLIFIPYLQDDIRKSINDYKTEFNFIDQKCIVLSHNDVKGIHYGPKLSTTGIDLEDIENNCDLFLNGHIHNGSRITKNGFNVGNLTGKTFEEDADKYIHPVYILDITESGEIGLDIEENPFAFNFYSFKVDTVKDLDQISNSKLKTNAVIAVSCVKSLLEETKKKVSQTSNIIESHISYRPEMNINKEASVELINGANYLDQLSNFTIQKLGDTQAVREELEKIIMG